MVLSPQKQNPLSAFMRQPKVYISLPSNGEFYPEGCLEPSETGQYAVYSMTAKDEMLLNVPDALMNGQAVVEVIQNCVPAIKNAWYIPSIDMDLILLSIRLATYGEMMTTPVKISDEIEFDYQVDLRLVLDSLLNNIKWNSAIPINDDITVFVRPLNYRQMTKSALQTFETQKIIQAVNNESLTDEQKQEIFTDSFVKLTSVTVGSVVNSIYRIDTSQGSVDDEGFIKEFIDNADKEIFNTIQTHLENLKEQNGIKPIVVDVTDEMKAMGVTGDTIEVPLTFDPSTFFG